MVAAKLGARSIGLHQAPFRWNPVLNIPMFCTIYHHRSINNFGIATCQTITGSDDGKGRSDSIVTKGREE